ncbi:MAG TPA: GNAT family protein [Dermatophilaceae bacterium]|nr:GNAT family protein [Dermatophilaceae bacterium]
MLVGSSGLTDEWLDDAVDVRLLEHQPTLVGDLVRLEPMSEQHLEGLWPMFADSESGDLTGPVAEFTREQVRRGLAGARHRHDRADWAVVRLADGEVLGEVVLFELDEDHATMTFRIALVGPDAFGRGYGSEATRLVRDFAFGPLGLHRLQLEVLDHNTRAQRVYSKAGFVVEGRRRAVQLIDGFWHDAIDMALLDTDPRPA